MTISFCEISPKVLKTAFSSCDKKSKCWTDPPLTKIDFQVVWLFLPFSSKRSSKNLFLKVNFPFDYELIDGEKLDLSSTSLRNKLKDNLFNEEEIPLKIIQYIKRNSLY